MRYENGVSDVYLRKFPRKVEQYNRPGPLPAYLAPYIGDQRWIRVAELGAGPVNTIGSEWPDCEVEIHASDSLANEYAALWRALGQTPLVPIVFQDMERLSYPDNMFHIVHCRNALDHTKDAAKAIEEMKRVCRPGGWVYLAHAPGQKRRFGGHHYHNFEELDLPGFQVLTTTESELITATWQKK